MRVSIAVIALQLLAVASCAQIYEGFVNRNVQRNIDLSSQFVKYTIDVTVANSGKSSASEYFLAVQNAENLSFLEVTKNGEVLKSSFSDVATSGDQSYSLYSVALPEPLAPQDTVELQVSAVFTHLIVPHPASISQQERQLVRYVGNHYFLSPYATQTQSTKVKLSSGSVESKTELSPTSQKGDTITYGPYDDVAALSYSRLAVHYENNKPFLTISSLVKEIEISHWGNVAVEETYALQHDGAKLKGTFSRFDYQRNPGGSLNCVNTMKTVLPAGAADVYYRDEIGNISTSNLWEHGSRGIELQLAPRFPLFGGWKIGFLVGYNLPLSKYVLRSADDSSRYVLDTNFGVTFDDAVIDHLVVKIIFPEGAKNFEIQTPFTYDAESRSTHYTYLDTAGRPVVIIEKRNVVSEHNQKTFQVAYTFSQLSMLQEPLLLIGVFFLFFLAVMIYVRVEINIGAPKRSAGSDAVSRLVDEARDLAERRNDLHDLLDKALDKAVRQRSAATYDAERKSLDVKLAKLAADSAKIISDADAQSKSVALKLKEVEKKEKAKLAAHLELIKLELSSKLSKSVNKSEYESQKAHQEQLLNAAEEDIASLLADLE
eukprot:TRINITY_DN4008_c0_g1_i1.p1 TRINITY_DN4008_c0_g1~~TRINITY_DN4008_c0_g1_i1.p1  ORF type:complete len:601 (-),score=272.45 TRINITY_DN4008_c0_g1_i1:354-2156(-)